MQLTFSVLDFFFLIKKTFLALVSSSVKWEINVSLNKVAVGVDVTM